MNWKKVQAVTVLMLYTLSLLQFVGDGGQNKLYIGEFGGLMWNVQCHLGVYHEEGKAYIEQHTGHTILQTVADIA